MKNKYTLWFSISLILLFFLCWTELIGGILHAQLFRRRPLRRIQTLLNDDSGYQVDPIPQTEPLIQGDGRFLERAREIITLFTASGKELKPVAIISLSSYDEFKQVIQIVADRIRSEASNFEEPVILNTLLTVAEKIIGQGIDTKQPVGLILQTDGVLYYPLLFTPLDLDSRLGQAIQSEYGQALPDGRYVLKKDVFNWPLGQLYLRQHNGWLFIATESQLDALPDDPTVLLRGLDQEHLLAARFDLQNVPQISTQTALGLGEMHAVVQAETEVEKASVRLFIGYLRSLAQQSDFLEYTFSYDRENSEYVLRQKEIVKPNTERAKLLHARRDATSPFHAFYHPENAILASHFLLYLTRHQSEQIETIVDELFGKHLLTEEERDYLYPKLIQRNKKTDQTETLRAAPTLSSPKPEDVEVSAGIDVGDTRDRLATLLALGSAQTSDSEMTEASTFDSSDPTSESGVPTEPIDRKLPEFEWTDLPEGELNETQKEQIVLKRIAACYYWALLGSLRSGTFDGVSTISQEHGMLAAYNIVEGERFLQAFDDVFADIAETYPELYEKMIDKDYGEFQGFRLTRVKLRLVDLIQTSPWTELISPRLVEREGIVVVLGVRRDAVCFAVGSGDLPEQRLLAGIDGMQESLPVYDRFFSFSAYQLGKAFAQSGDPNRFWPLKLVAADANPDTNAYAYSQFSDTEKTITLRINALLTPSIWRLRENLRRIRYYRFE